MQPDESLDVAALRALVGEASISLDDAAELLDASGAVPEDITNPDLRPLFAVIADRVRRRAPLDFQDIKATLKGPPGVLEVACDVLTDSALGFTARRLAALHEAGTRVRFVDQLRGAAVAAKGGAPVGDLDRMVRDAAAQLQAGSRVRNCAGDSVALLDHLMQSWNGKGPPRLLTGFQDLDDVLGGLVANLIVIGARTGVGKSALVAGLVRNWVRQGVKVGVLQYEDAARDMEARLVACEAGVSLKHARGDLLPNEHQRGLIAHGLEFLSKHEHLLETDDARPAGKPSDIIASLRAMRRRGCGVALLDNLTCVRFDGVEDRHDLVVERALSDIRAEAQSLAMPVLVVGHLKRGMGDADEARKPPRLSDFRNASAWENYSRIALGMWLDGDQVAMRVLKQTNGPAGDDFTVAFQRDAAVVVGMSKRVSSAPPASSRGGPSRPTYPRPQYQPGGD